MYKKYQKKKYLQNFYSYGYKIDFDKFRRNSIS